MQHIKLFEDFNEKFKDVNGKDAKPGDFIKLDDGTVGKVKRIFKSGKDDRMGVDFRAYYLELNPMSEFEIIEPDEKMQKAFA